ncbi:ABC transporter ATP-binding protein [Alloscardovia criceti]|uniref:ABC transporter ATP-binding protein n=1 Tax=Alloscardovia criceti TaxID=356828 RepID=UPI00035CFDBC|nr:dipeptide/oligopeptide/nickel ABC transporter ATP-binding protein [Alloscardovia criceti]
MELVKLQGVSHTFRGETQPAVQNISLSIHSGERVALVGQSGSGKTTILNIALGFITPSQGQVQVANAQSTGLIFQNPSSSLNPRLTVEQIVQEGKPEASREEVEQALASVSLEPREVLHKYVGDISGGQAQRVAIARALMDKPDLIVADEPVSAVDVLGKQQIISTLHQLQQERAYASLIVLHDLGVAQQLSDTIIVLHNGVIVEQGKTQEILASPQQEYTRRLIAAAQWSV